ncbi:MAG: saccharopine dehydrogenase NADP-binding domain-containing protein [Candidatus Nanopelagicales bacterium]
MSDFDLVVYGATGFTGKLVAQYLAERGGPERIALAGRNPDRLAHVAADLDVSWPMIVADASDPKSLAALAESTKAVVTTVGPYMKYGLPLVEACARAGTHYADLAGEVLFMRQSIERYDQLARETGARIVHASGFDSIPSDLGVYLLHEAAEGELGETVMAVRWASGGFSGGTIASGIGQMEAARQDPRLAKIMSDPYALTPGAAGPDAGDQVWVNYEPVLDSWTGPFLMAMINTRVVRRSNFLSDFSYGRGFRYKEVVATGPGWGGRARATALAAGTTGGSMALSFGPTRSLAQRFLPDPGEGPDQESREKGGFRVEFRSTLDDGSVYGAEVMGKGDPGYAATSRMLSEAGLSLAATKGEGGVLTPSTAMGDDLVDRLRFAGMTLRAWQVR